MSFRWLKQKGFKDWSDQQLLEAFQQSGEEQYFSALFERHTHLVYYSCKRFIPDEEDCKDMVMVIIGKVYEKLPGLEVQHFKSWLNSFIRNQCISHLRDQNRYIDKNIAWEKSQEHYNGVMEPEEPKLFVKEEGGLLVISPETIRHALKALDDNQQLCIHLFYFEGKSYKEIMATTHFTANEVKSHLQNGRRKLKRALRVHQQDKQ